MEKILTARQRGAAIAEYSIREPSPPTPRAHAPDNFKQAPPRMKENPNKAFHHYAPQAARG